MSRQLQPRSFFLIRASAVAAAATLLGVCVAQAQAPHATHAQLSVKALMTRDLVGAPDKEVTLASIEVPPDVSPAPHEHEAQLFVYVLQGHLIVQVRGRPPLRTSTPCPRTRAPPSLRIFWRS